MQKKKTRKRKLGGSDQLAYRVISFAYYVDDQLHVDTAIDDRTVTDFLLELNRNFQKPSILYAQEVSKSQYEKLEKAMETLDESDPEETEIPIGGGHTVRMLDGIDLDDALAEEYEPEPDFSFRNIDPDILDEGDDDLSRDGSGLEDLDLDEFEA